MYWKKSSEELPNSNQIVVIWMTNTEDGTESSRMVLGKYVAGTWYRKDDGFYGDEIVEVSHWFEVPPPVNEPTMKELYQLTSACTPCGGSVNQAKIDILLGNKLIYFDKDFGAYLPMSLSYLSSEDQDKVYGCAVAASRLEEAIDNMIDLYEQVQEAGATARQHLPSGEITIAVERLSELLNKENGENIPEGLQTLIGKEGMNFIGGK